MDWPSRLLLTKESNIYRRLKLKTRPKRIWAICLMLIVVPLMSVALSSYLLITGNMPEALELTLYNLSIMFLLPCALIFCSVMLFLGKPNSHRYVLSLSIAYFGLLIYQNIYLFQIENLPEETISKITSNIIRTVIELLLVIWVVFSNKTKEFLSEDNSPR
ncbi:MAG: hypothetical protein COA74_10835 [Gammaproteobacteria bacterium]|nr:MAG: hypothetical protein COA74_10835 [Gammaproteobacteria bacterium]